MVKREERGREVRETEKREKGQHIFISLRYGKITRIPLANV